MWQCDGKDFKCQLRFVVTTQVQGSIVPGSEL